MCFPAHEPRIMTGPRASPVSAAAPECTAVWRYATSLTTCITTVESASVPM
jgi:hypothetical protein